MEYFCQALPCIRGLYLVIGEDLNVWVFGNVGERSDVLGGS